VMRLGKCFDLFLLLLRRLPQCAVLAMQQYGALLEALNSSVDGLPFAIACTALEKLLPFIAVDAQRSVRAPELICRQGKRRHPDPDLLVIFDCFAPRFRAVPAARKPEPDI